MIKKVHLLLFLFSSLLSIGQDGDVDLNFGVNGISTISNPNGDHEFKALSIQTDDRIVVAGYAVNSGQYQFLISRFLNNGQIDESFGENGRVDIAFREFDSLWDVKVQADGKIVACGLSLYENQSNSDFIALRLNSDGSLDNSFGDSGIAAIGSATYDRAWRMEFQSDGKLLLCGTSFSNNQNDMKIMRLNIDGTLDTSFANDGAFILDLGANESFSDINSLSDGTIVFTGATGTSGVVGFLDSTGNLTSAFNGAGYSLVNESSSYDAWLASVLVSSNDEVYTIGTTAAFLSAYDGWISKMNSQGVLDTSWGNDGMKTYDNGFNFDEFTNAIWTSDGKILVSGVSELGSGDYGYTAWRINEDGSKDNSFSQNAIQLLDQGLGTEAALGCGEDSSGNYLLCGFWNTDGYESFLTKLIGTASVGTNQISDDRFVVYPNPFIDRIYVDYKNQNEIETVKLFSIEGKEIDMDYRISDRQIQIDVLDELTSKGNYLLLINENQSVLITAE